MFPVLTVLIKCMYIGIVKIRRSITSFRIQLTPLSTVEMRWKNRCTLAAEFSRKWLGADRVEGCGFLADWENRTGNCL